MTQVVDRSKPTDAAQLDQIKRRNRFLIIAVVVLAVVA